MTAPHPLRCETCKNKHSWNLTKPGFNCMGKNLPNEIFGITAQRGCASHSSTTTSAESVLGCRQEVKDFAVLMEQKLRKNDHKSHWSKESFTYLFQRLDEEMRELNQAVASAKTDYSRITDEAVDVANFLMMIVDNMAEPRQERER